MTEQLHFHFSLSCIGEGNGNPLQYSCLENPRDRGAWWAAVYGVTQSQTRLKRLSSSSSSSRPPCPSVYGKVLHKKGKLFTGKWGIKMMKLIILSFPLKLIQLKGLSFILTPLYLWIQLISLQQQLLLFFYTFLIWQSKNFNNCVLSPTFIFVAGRRATVQKASEAYLWIQLISLQQQLLLFF